MRSVEFKVLENVENGHLENTYNNGATGDDPATLEELSSELQKLGLSDLEVKVYLTLLTYGTLTAVQAADRSAIPRSRAYDALASLERKGLVARPPVKPTKYGVLPPQESLRVLVDPLSIFELIFTDYSEKRQRIFELAHLVRRSGATAVYTAEANPMNPVQTRDGIIEYAVDGFISLRYIEPKRGALKYAVRTIKVRRSDHSKELCQFEITNRGPRVWPHRKAELV